MGANRARLIVELAAEQAWDAETKAWLRNEPIFEAWAEAIIYQAPPWETVVNTDRRAALTIWGWAAENMLCWVREELEAARATAKRLDDRIDELLRDNLDLVTDFASQNLAKTADGEPDEEYEELLRRSAEDAITVDLRRERFDTAKTWRAA